MTCQRAFILRCLFSAIVSGWISTQAVGAESAALQLEVIPQPQQVKPGSGGFSPGKSLTIRVTDTAPNRFAASLLRDSLRATHGIDAAIATLPQSAADRHEFTLVGESGEPGAVPAVPQEQAAEGYAMLVDAGGVRIAAASDTGLFYGVQTLIQLAEQSQRDKAAIPGMEIVDWPAFTWRGRYFDASQYMGTVVVSRQNIECEIKRLARYKLNCYGADLYNLVPFKSFPDCADENTLSLSDWTYLVELARRYHVTIIPSFQSFGQIYQVIWSCDAGKPYREETSPGMICPSRPENLQFLQGLYKDLLSVFKYTPYLGVGCSEVGEFAWQEKYCPRCKARIDAGETYYDIYYSHVNACAKAVEAAAKELGRDVRPLMWGDEFYMGYKGKRWVGIDKMDKKILMGHWMYWPLYAVNPPGNPKDYNGISGFLERGFDVFFVSASFEFNTYLHDLSPEDPKDGKWDLLCESGIYNIADQAKWAFQYNQQKYPGHVVGGVCATFSQHDIRGWDTTWYAYALQGEYTWGNPTRPMSERKDRFTNAFAATFYGARDRETANTIAAALRDLDATKSEIERNNYLVRDIIGEYDIHDNFYNDNDLIKSLDLIAELIAKPQGQGKTADDVRQRAEKVRQTAQAYRAKLAALTSHVGNPKSLGYLISAAFKMENHAARTVYLLDHQATIAKLAAATDPAAKKKLLEEIDALSRRLDVLRRDTRVIADEMDQLAFGSVSKLVWSAGGATEQTAVVAGDTTGYHKVLNALAELDKRLTEAKKALQ